jgi:hypothetical protein
MIVDFRITFDFFYCSKKILKAFDKIVLESYAGPFLFQN